MNTPIIDFVEKYNKQKNIRFHMPGHKGKKFLGCESADITEIYGADSLYEAEGIIEQSENNASRLFGFGKTLYSTEGSSQCLRAMLYLAMLDATQKGKNSHNIIAVRNVHKAFIHACALLDLSVEWLYPSDNESSLLSCKITAEDVKVALQKVESKPFALYLTAPDYTGYSDNIAEIAKICDKYDVPLLVDNAHGAYLKFLRPSRHPLDLGAYMSCDSAHKTLPVLTGGAYLQLSEKVPLQIISQAKNALSLFGSTSPSYLILQSLDLCNRYLDNNYQDKLQLFIEKVTKAKDKLKLFGWDIKNSDPLKIIINPLSKGYTGTEIADILRSEHIECEFADFESIILMVTPENSIDDITKLKNALLLPQKSQIVYSPCAKISHGTYKMSIREAFFHNHETINTNDALGKICASPTVSCPPAVPIAISGELITAEHIKLMNSYGIKQIEIIAE